MTREEMMVFEEVMFAEMYEEMAEQFDGRE